MKKTTLIATAFVAMMMLSPATSEAGKRVYVKIKPPKAKIVVVKPNRPARDAIWIGGHYRWNGKRYVWKSGRWVKPRRDHLWIPGHWAHNRYGWFWVAGHWKRI